MGASGSLATARDSRKRRRDGACMARHLCHMQRRCCGGAPVLPARTLSFLRLQPRRTHGGYALPRVWSPSRVGLNCRRFAAPRWSRSLPYRWHGPRHDPRECQIARKTATTKNHWLALCDGEVGGACPRERSESRAERPTAQAVRTLRRGRTARPVRRVGSDLSRCVGVVHRERAHHAVRSWENVARHAAAARSSVFGGIGWCSRSLARSRGVGASRRKGRST